MPSLASLEGVFHSSWLSDIQQLEHDQNVLDEFWKEAKEVVRKWTASPSQSTRHVELLETTLKLLPVILGKVEACTFVKSVLPNAQRQMLFQSFATHLPQLDTIVLQSESENFKVMAIVWKSMDRFLGFVNTKTPLQVTDLDLSHVFDGILMRISESSTRILQHAAVGERNKENLSQVSSDVASLFKILGFSCAKLQAFCRKTNSVPASAVPRLTNVLAQCFALDATGFDKHAACDAQVILCQILSISLQGKEPFTEFAQFAACLQRNTLHPRGKLLCVVAVLEAVSTQFIQLNVPSQLDTRLMLLKTLLDMLRSNNAQLALPYTQQIISCINRFLLRAAEDTPENGTALRPLIHCVTQAIVDPNPILSELVVCACVTLKGCSRFRTEVVHRALRLAMEQSKYVACWPLTKDGNAGSYAKYRQAVVVNDALAARVSRLLADCDIRFKESIGTFVESLLPVSDVLRGLVSKPGSRAVHDPFWSIECISVTPLFRFFPANVTPLRTSPEHALHALEAVPRGVLGRGVFSTLELMVLKSVLEVSHRAVSCTSSGRVNGVWISALIRALVSNADLLFAEQGCRRALVHGVLNLSIAQLLFIAETDSKAHVPHLENVLESVRQLGRHLVQPANEDHKVTAVVWTAQLFQVLGQLDLRAHDQTQLATSLAETCTLWMDEASVFEEKRKLPLLTYSFSKFHRFCETTTLADVKHVLPAKFRVQFVKFLKSESLDDVSMQSPGNKMRYWFPADAFGALLLTADGSTASLEFESSTLEAERLAARNNAQETAAHPVQSAIRAFLCSVPIADVNSMPGTEFGATHTRAIQELRSMLGEGCR